MTTLSRLQTTAIAAALALAAATPLAATADGSAGVWSGDGAAPVPHIPGTFAGAPTNDDPSAGQFSVAFDTTGHFVRIGRVDEPRSPIAVVPDRERRQAAFTSGRESAASAATFARFRLKLRALAH